MSLLTPRDREYILNQLQLAPDSVLADAMLAFNTIRDKLMVVRKLAEPPEATQETFAQGIAEYEKELVEKAAIRTNVSPGESQIGKIGGATKEGLLQNLRDGVPIPSKYDEHMKLLWARNEVKFDGEEYYL